jgi:exodeoxyribonuclease III
MRVPGKAQAPSVLKVLTLNIWGGGLHNGAVLEDTVAVLRATGADIIGLQEVGPHTQCKPGPVGAGKPVTLAPALARALGFHCHDQTGRRANAVLSRFPITGATKSGLGVRIDAGRHTITLFNLHLEDAPYQPYQLMRIPYDGAPFLTTAAEAVAAATAARGGMIDQLEHDLLGLDNAPVIITGDFNEPSFRDWTARAATIGRHPIAVDWPATHRIETLGFTDVFRAACPDEVARPGDTWTVLSGEPEHHDRIDFIFARGPGLSVVSAAMVGEKAPEADIVITPWPSDHRAVLATVRLAGKARKRQAAAPSQ